MRPEPGDPSPDLRVQHWSGTLALNAPTGAPPLQGSGSSSQPMAVTQVTQATLLCQALQQVVDQGGLSPSSRRSSASLVEPVEP
mmetsp:Transcript_21636/g.35873  ORF Transcript_21636/g.35873 Transcript_21636/m.35873 type:complete len:84 (+) Transcript_21636:130-381(+)